mmetsp:Transcript_11092/g.15391  ORF Transcript_11092/g.15391 Transcript_11092/m.15391 type:complete len:84 (+) Transcript_11092:1-252(+)
MDAPSLHNARESPTGREGRSKLDGSRVKKRAVVRDDSSLSHDGNSECKFECKKDELHGMKLSDDDSAWSGHDDAAACVTTCRK